MLQCASPYTPTLRAKLEKWQAVCGSSTALNIEPSVRASSPVYGAGIQFDPNVHFDICEGFSLSRLHSVLDLLEENFDGIVFPYFYGGTPHTLFPWHVEDGGTFSVNYNIAGAAKLWQVLLLNY